MNRRSIFKLFAGAVMASAVEVCGLRNAAAAVTQDFSLEAQIAAMVKNLHESIADIWEDRYPFSPYMAP